ncbi:MAG: Mrp/NBP35 family ATP-binding protein [Bacteroidales bacterium]|jgi:ATP-binding protein involved in chromosome partitioning|nr:Mrp/NBP35 family ATP-binding protein [Bacteroidales bacterium]MDD4001332.1 Mrp/NBP35 family ATP-binding protein [Bacteroidales bacterium]MDD4528246.1 Mrp/NBP35 family ATP-binding protein [Bacteroidales bacterium]MDD4829871.1 Mrp/NBP35 family ATP-binding protein [Bacteroidales bacterium]
MNIFEQRKDREQKIAQALLNVKFLVAIGSGKGGVGKSTVAANLAISLAKIGFKVGLADVDIYGPSIPTLFNIENQEVLGEEIDGKLHFLPIEKFGIKLMSIGFFVDSSKALMWRGPMASNTIIQMVSETLWGELDYLIFDMPPGTGDIQLTLSSQFKLSGAVFVSTAQQLSIADVRRAVNMFTSDEIKIPILGLVENMAYFVPKELPNNKYYIFGKGGCEKLSKELDIELLEQIPISKEISETNDNGNPISLNSDSIESNSFLSLARKINNKLNNQ